MVQKTVGKRFDSGYVGNFAFESPRRVGAVIVDSEDYTKNIAGRAFTYSADQETVQVGGTGVFAGIFVRPNELPGFGVLFTPEGLPFVANGTAIQLATMGEVYVAIDQPNTKIGAKIGYDNATGELKVVADASSVPSGVTLIPNCEVTRHPSSTETPSLAIIKLTN